MTIRNAHSYLNGVWDWAILDGCFGGTKIRPTDIDGFVERNGWKLILEAKSLGAPIPMGQMITFRRAVEEGNATVIVIWGEQNQPRTIRVITYFGDTGEIPCDVEGLRARVDGWWLFANTHSSIFRRLYADLREFVGVMEQRPSRKAIELDDPESLRDLLNIWDVANAMMIDFLSP